MDLTITLTVVAACLILYALYVVIRVVRYNGYSSSQKVFQCIFFFLVPLFGALIVHMVLRADVTPPLKKDKDFDADYIGSGS